MEIPKGEAVELNSRGQQPRLGRQPRATLKGSNSLLSDASRVALFVGSDPGALPPATKLVRYANHRVTFRAKPVVITQVEFAPVRNAPEVFCLRVG